MLLARHVTVPVDQSDAAPLERSGYVVLGLLADLGPQRMGTLALAADLDPSTISRQVQTMIVRGYVRRTPDPDDGRAVVTGLTELGEATLARARRTQHDQLEAALADWSDEEHAQLVALLTRLNSDLGEPRRE